MPHYSRWKIYHIHTRKFLSGSHPTKRKAQQAMQSLYYRRRDPVANALRMALVLIEEGRDGIYDTKFWDDRQDKFARAEKGPVTE